MLFHLGQIVATPGALALLTRELDAGGRPGSHYLLRHGKGDWGDLGTEDKAANDAALKHGSRLLSAYETDTGKLWIITECDRSATTMLLPSEY